MTFNPAAMIAEARSHVGFHEGPNNENPFSRWQYGDTFEPWCDSFVSYCAFQAGYRFPDYYTFGEKGDNNVGFTHQHAIRQGTWRSSSTIARPCWLVILSFGVPDQHIEIVLQDGGGAIQTIGGNTGDSVAYRTRQRQNVVGFVALDIDVLSPAPSNAPLNFTTRENPMGMIALPATNATPAGKTPTARAVGGDFNFVLLENGGRLIGDQPVDPSGKDRTRHYWLPPLADRIPDASIIDTADLRGGGPGQPPENAIVATFVDPSGAIQTYKASIAVPG